MLQKKKKSKKKKKVKSTYRPYFFLAWNLKHNYFFFWPKSKIALLKIKAHELRALSASWSYMNKIPIEHIIKAAVWSSRSTFAKFYLRDVNTQGENLRLMGPVVSAQKVVGGQSGLSHPRY